METISESSARAYGRTYFNSNPDRMNNKIKLGYMYYFEKGSAYFHDIENPVRLNYKHKDLLFIAGTREIKVSFYPKSLTNKKIIKWIKSWADNEDKVVTPGGKIVSLAESTISNEKEFIYFILNTDSNAVKIGRAKNVDKRLKSLQVSNPVKLILLKTIEVESGKPAKEKEEYYHKKFYHLNLLGEWFKYDRELQDFIQKI